MKSKALLIAIASLLLTAFPITGLSQTVHTPQERHITQSQNVKVNDFKIPQELKHTAMQLVRNAGHKNYVELSLPKPWFSNQRQKAVIVPGLDAKPDTLTTTAEDVEIMCRILDKKLTDSKLKSEKSWMPFFDNTQNTKGIYLGDFGVLFISTVDFPLAPAAESTQTAKEEGDPFWEQTKEELKTNQGNKAFSGDGFSFAFSGQPTEHKTYDAQKVELLKDTLLNSIKHCTNIRGLAPDHNIILVARSPEPVVFMAKGKFDSANVSFTAKDEKNKSAVPDSPSHSIVIYTKKSLVDSFAKGKLDTEQVLNHKDLELFIY